MTEMLSTVEMIPSESPLRRCIRQPAGRLALTVSLVYLGNEDKLYSIVLSASIGCPGNFQSAGKPAQRVDKRNGKPYAHPCWLERNEYKEAQLYNETIVRTKYCMKDWSNADVLNARLKQPEKAPAWSSWMYNNRLYGADDVHDMQEQAHAAWFDDPSNKARGYWQRFWRDISPENNTLAVWIEYNEEPEGEDWYPKVFRQYGNEIYETNIPDAKTK